MEKRSFYRLKNDHMIYIFEFISFTTFETLFKYPNRRIHKNLLNLSLSNIPFFSSCPSSLHFNDIFLMNYDDKSLANVFTIFVNNKNQLILAYPSKYFSIELLEINTKEVLASFKDYQFPIFCVRYHKGSNDEEFLITSSYDKMIRIWSLKTYNRIFYISYCHNSPYIYSCLLTTINNTTYIVSSSYSYERMKVFTMDGILLRDFGDENDSTLFIDYWNDYRYFGRHMIINCNTKDIKLYDFLSGSIFKVFIDKYSSLHFSAMIADIDNSLLLYETDKIGFVRIWNILTETLIQRIHVGLDIRGLVMWNANYLLVSDSKGIYVVNIKSYKVEKRIYSDLVLVYNDTIVKFYHPTYGESILCGCKASQMLLWSQRNE